MITVGIDPGAKGGVVALKDGHFLSKLIMPTKGDGTISSWHLGYYMSTISDLAKNNNEDLIIGLEEVHSLYGMSAKSNFNFGRNFQAPISVLDYLRLDWGFVKAKVWQKEIFGDMEVILNKKGKKDTKAMSIKRAQELYPDADLTPTERAKKPSDGIADALCIAEYLSRTK